MIRFRMISEGSRDTEDWSNICCKFSFAVKITFENTLKENSYFNTYYYFYCIFDHINAALVSIRDFFQKHKKTYRLQTWTVEYIAFVM